MDLSVVIVSFNVRYYLEECLHSVFRASENINTEVFVVDNNSSDGSASMVAHLFPRVRLIENNTNMGFSAANNQALRAVTGRYVLILNPDTIVEENAFSECISFMDDHPDGGAAGVMMIGGNGKFLPESRRAFPAPGISFFKLFGFTALFPGSRFFNKYYLGNLDPASTCQADVISGAFMFIRREALIRAGLFDEEFFLYGEDIDYSLRIKRAGYSNYYFPGVRIIHFKGESSKTTDFSARTHFYRAMMVYVRKHYSKGGAIPFVALIQGAICLRAGISFVAGFANSFFGMILSAIRNRKFYNTRKILVVSDPEDHESLEYLVTTSLPGRHTILHFDTGSREPSIAAAGRLRDFMLKNRVHAILLSGKSISRRAIIDIMIGIRDMKPSVWIASNDLKFLIGSKFAAGLPE